MWMMKNFMLQNKVTTPFDIFRNIHCIGNGDVDQDIVDVDQGIGTSGIDVIDDYDLNQEFAVSNQGMLYFQFNMSWFFVFITYIHLCIARLKPQRYACT